MTKYEWRKSEKELYLPKNKPMKIDVKAMNYITIKGHGDPNESAFKERVEAFTPLPTPYGCYLKKALFQMVTLNIPCIH
ncbi:hypothetical protein [Listeria fleischmannii]|uniref:hypothetical protein n=1 Tax=Listeria fleischmannii TaxID=1069827 RepID=UPI0003A4EC0B